MAEAEAQQAAAVSKQEAESGEAGEGKEQVKKSKETSFDVLAMEGDLTPEEMAEFEAALSSGLGKKQDSTTLTEETDTGPSSLKQPEEEDQDVKAGDSVSEPSEKKVISPRTAATAPPPRAKNVEKKTKRKFCSPCSILLLSLVWICLYIAKSKSESITKYFSLVSFCSCSCSSPAASRRACCTSSFRSPQETRGDIECLCFGK